MNYEFEETPDSRSFTANPPSYSVKFTASGEFDDALVTNDAIMRTPVMVDTPVGTLYRQDVKVKEVAHKLYSVEVPYGPRKRDVGSISFSFDTTGGTARVTTAKEHVKSYDRDGEAPGDWFEGAIGVQQDGSIDGCDVIIPALKLSVTYRHPAGVVTMDHVRALSSITGMVNSVEFLGYEPGELLFLGATGGDGTEAEAELTYHFAASQNATGLTFGPIEDVVKGGHEFLWPDFSDDDSAGLAGKRLDYIHVERVYDSINFGSVFGWS